MQEKYYVDSCIWLNLFKKEGDASKGTPYWRITEEFIHYAEKQNREIIVTPAVLKEISCRLKSKYPYVMDKIKKEQCISIVKLDSADYDFARALEKRLGFKISFYDCIHVAVCKRLSLLLVTRDKLLIKLAGGIIKIKMPEELIR